MKHSKHQVEQYCIRPEKGETFYWADIFIDVTGPKSGTLLIRSDYGSWDYYWGSCGTDFKSFLLKLEPGYLMDKLEQGKPREFRETETIHEMRREIAGLLENEEITPEQSQEANRELDELFCNADSNQVGYWE